MIRSASSGTSSPGLGRPDFYPLILNHGRFFEWPDFHIGSTLTGSVFLGYEWPAFWVSVSTDTVASAATDEQIIMMHVCLCQFVDETLARIQLHGTSWHMHYRLQVKKTLSYGK